MCSAIAASDEEIAGGRLESRLPRTSTDYDAVLTFRPQDPGTRCRTVGNSTQWILNVTCNKNSTFCPMAMEEMPDLVATVTRHAAAHIGADEHSL